MRKLLLILFGIICLSCNSEKTKEKRTVSRIEINTILEDSTLSIRAIEILDSQSLAFAANNNSYGLYSVGMDKWVISRIEHDSLDIEFRSIANNSIDYIFTDPPFGANIMYSELSFLLESWIKIKTNSTAPT